MNPRLPDCDTWLSEELLFLDSDQLDEFEELDELDELNDLKEPC